MEDGSGPRSVRAVIFDSVVGGGGRSDYWIKLIVTVFGIPLRKPVGSEFGAEFVRPDWG